MLRIMLAKGKRFQSYSLFITLPVCLLLLFGSTAAMADQTSQDADEKVVQQKLGLLDVLLNRSKQIKLINESDNQEAKNHLAESRKYADLAKASLENQDIKTASDSVNVALKALDSARATFSHRPNATLLEQAKYRELLESIRTFRSSMSSETAANLENGKLDEMLLRADAAKQKDDYVAANAELNRAYQLVISAVNGSYKEATLVYSLNFETPEHEYLYELQRYEGNKSLIDKLLAQKEQSKTTSLVIRYLKQAVDTREEAEVQASQGKFEEAIITMEKTSSQLRRAMGMLGINF